MDSIDLTIIEGIMQTEALIDQFLTLLHLKFLTLKLSVML